jgi:MSHA biogenesis protein MshO
MRPAFTDRRGHRGFTLVEMIISIAILGLLAAVAAPLLRMPLDVYLESSNRIRVTTDMDWVHAKLKTDFATALPNSIRVRQVGTRYFIEFLQVHGHGRYRSGKPDTGYPAQACTPTPNCDKGNASDEADALAFGTPASACADSCFFTLGRIVNVGNAAPIANTDLIVVDPTNVTGTSGDPYANDVLPAIQSNKSLLTAIGPYDAAKFGHQISMTAHAFPAIPLPGNETARPKRFYVISNSPVTYVCDTTAAPLTRHWGYAIAPVQPVAFGAAVPSAALSSSVACVVNAARPLVEPAGVRGRGGLVSLRMIFTVPGVGGGPGERTELVFTAAVNNG